MRYSCGLWILCNEYCVSVATCCCSEKHDSGDKSIHNFFLKRLTASYSLSRSASPPAEEIVGHQHWNISALIECASPVSQYPRDEHSVA